MNEAPAYLSARVVITDPFFCATVALRGCCPGDQRITVLHNAQTKLDSYEVYGEDRIPQLQVSDRDTLLIEVRDDDGVITAVGHYEIRFVCSEALGAVLAPMATSNIILDQRCEEGDTCDTEHHIEALEVVL
jgi:hypothetical protein